MGRKKVIKAEAAAYAATVKHNVEEAIHDAGFPGYYHQDALTIEHLARISQVLGTSITAWMPTDPQSLVALGAPQLPAPGGDLELAPGRFGTTPLRRSPLRLGASESVFAG